MVIGSILIYHQFRRSRATALAFGFMALAGIGIAMVGLFPENMKRSLHALGATLPFVFGNVSILMFGLLLTMPRWVRVYTILTGIITLVALSLFASQHYLGVGPGSMERLVIHPQTIWLILFGLYLTQNHYRTQRP